MVFVGRQAALRAAGEEQLVQQPVRREVATDGEAPSDPVPSRDAALFSRKATGHAGNSEDFCPLSAMRRDVTRPSVLSEPSPCDPENQAFLISPRLTTGNRCPWPARYTTL